MSDRVCKKCSHILPLGIIHVCVVECIIELDEKHQPPSKQNFLDKLKELFKKIIPSLKTPLENDDVYLVIDIVSGPEYKLPDCYIPEDFSYKVEL